MTTTNPKSAVIFSPISSINSERQSTDRQVKDLLSFAKKNDFEVIKVYEERISGAKRNEERSVLTECIEFCLAHKIDTLLSSELSRIGRNTLQVLKTLDLLHTNGTNVYIQNIGLNTLTNNKEINPLASIIITVLAEMYSIERTNIQYRLNSGRQNYIQSGGKLGRKIGSSKSEDRLKEEYKDVIGHLKKGYSIRNTAKLTGNSISTVQRIKKKFL